MSNVKVKSVDFQSDRKDSDGVPDYSCATVVVDGVELLVDLEQSESDKDFYFVVRSEGDTADGWEDRVEATEAHSNEIRGALYEWFWASQLEADKAELLLLAKFGAPCPTGRLGAVLDALTTPPPSGPEGTCHE